VASEPTQLVFQNHAAIAETFARKAIIMSKPEWGLKRVCLSCGTRYYDMRKNPPVCPNCGAAFDPEQVLKTKRRSPVDDKSKKSAALAEATPEDIEDIVAVDGEGDDAVIEDAEELGNEDSDLDEVVDLEENETP
jgi:uncharacterized protein (TIGR02300 family)